MSSRCKERHAVSCQAIDLSMHFCRPKASDGSDSGSSLTKVARMRISDKFCQILKEVLPLSALAIQLNYPKTKGKFCRDSQN